ncbi:MAG: hypothetical protein K1X89_22025, partial [Myxococcaceae bacterium]|nr:hypothetical protein [Myxococcaceae bacterium]
LAQSLGVLGQPGKLQLQKVASIAANAAGGTLVDPEGNTWTKPGDVACSGPGTSGNVRYYLPGGGYPGERYAAVDPKTGGIQLLVWNTGSGGGAPRISLFSIHCGQAESLLGSLDLTASTTPSTAEVPFGFFDLLARVDPQGRFCTPALSGYLCFQGGASLTATQVLSASAVRAQLVGASVDWTKVVPEATKTMTETAAVVGATTFSSDGTLYAVFEVELAEPGGVQVLRVKWVLEKSPQGVIVARFGPEATSQRGAFAAQLAVRKTLGRVGNLAVDEARGVLLAYPRAGQRFEYSKFVMRSIFDGVGAATWRLRADAGAANDQPGHLELSQVFEQSIGNPGNPIQVVMQQAPDGGVLFASAAGIFRLAYDSDDVDMDEDGLTAAEERMLGSSDYSQDSDGKGVRDGVEVKLYGSNPASGADDAAHLRVPEGNVEYAASTLIREKLDVEVQRQTWPSSWLCGMGTCTDRDGKKVLTGAPLNGPFVTEDGVHALSNTGSEIRRYALPSGTAETVAKVSDLSALIGSATGLEPIPGKGSRVFMVGDGRVIAFGDGPAQVVFDLVQEQCKSKLGTCGPPLLDTTVYLADTYNTLQPIGFDPVIDRLLVLAVGNFDQFLLAVAPGKPPVALARGKDLPVYLLDTGSGQYFSAAVPSVMTPLATGDLWSFYEGALGYVSGDYQPYAGSRTDYVGGSWGRGFDDSLYTTTSAGPAARGLFELVRMEDRIDPGDVLLFAGPSSLDVTSFQPSLTKRGPYLYRVGRRGGTIAFFDKVGREGVFSALTAVRGMGVASDGRICAAGLDGKLTELFDPDAAHVPQRIRTLGAVTGAVDCLYSSDGLLHVLTESPTTISVLDSRQQLVTPTVHPVTGLSTPTRFVRLSDGSYLVADAAGPLGCVGATGGAATVGKLSVAGLTLGSDGKLYLLDRSTGELLSVDPAAACSASAAPTPLSVDVKKLMALTGRSASANFPWVVANLAQRPDGRLLVMPARSRLTPDTSGNPINDPTYLFFVDPADKSVQVSHLEFDTASAPSAMVLVPGGTWRDPWGPGSAGSGGGAGTGGGSGSSGGGAGTGGGAGGGGACGCGAMPGAAMLAALALLAVVRRRPARAG